MRARMCPHPFAPAPRQAGDTSVHNTSLDGSLNASYASIMETIGGGGVDGTPNRSFVSMRSAVRAAIPKNFVKDRARAIEGITPMAGMSEEGGGDGSSGVSGVTKADPASSGETCWGMNNQWRIHGGWGEVGFRARMTGCAVHRQQWLAVHQRSCRVYVCPFVLCLLNAACLTNVRLLLVKQTQSRAEHARASP